MRRNALRLLTSLRCAPYALLTFLNIKTLEYQLKQPCNRSYSLFI